MRDETYILDIEKGIAELALKFEKQPEIFQQERDFHYELHDILLEKTSLKMRWELITNTFYRKVGGMLKPDLESNHNARFDIAAISGNSENVEFAFEFNFDTEKSIGKTNNSFKEHTLRDFEKLSNIKNAVGKGYILCFVKSEIIQTSTVNRLKRKIKENNANKDALWQILKSIPINPKIKIALIECDIISGEKSLIIRDLPDKWLCEDDVFIKKT